MTDPVLEEDQGWLLLRIASGRGHEVTIAHGASRTGYMLEAMEQADLITVRRTPEGYRCAILKRGRTALREWKEAMVAEAEERLKARAE